MSAGWIGLIAGCVFTFAVLFAVAMGCAAKRGDGQNRRAAKYARARRESERHSALRLRVLPFDQERDEPPITEQDREAAEAMWP